MSENEGISGIIPDGEKHGMLDLETMGTGPYAPIVAVGIVIFNSEGILKEVGFRVDFKSAFAAGEVDAETVEWWLRQSEYARSNLLDGGNKHLFEAALHRIEMELRDCDAYWSRGEDFDLKLVNDHAAKLRRDRLDFRKFRSARTVAECFPHIKPQRDASTKHSALSDALHQTRHILMINDYVRELRLYGDEYVTQSLFSGK